MNIQNILSHKKLLNPLVVVIAVVVTLVLVAPFNTLADAPAQPVCPPTPTTSCPCVTGEVTAFAGTTAPACYLLADGSEVSRSTYANLFNTINTTYGAGDGANTFNVPDLRGRFPLGYDNMGGASAGRVTNSNGNTLGGSAGEEYHTLSIAEMPQHNHTLGAHGLGGSSTTSFEAAAGWNYTGYTQNAGGNQAHNNMPPYLTLNYLICVGE